MGREKEMGGRKRHLDSFIWWTMINGLAFSRSVLPQSSLWASPDKRVFEGERTPQILLFVPDLAKPRPQCFDFNQVKPAKRGFVCACVYYITSICVRRDSRDRRGEKSSRNEEKNSTLHQSGMSPHYSFKDIHSFAFGVRGWIWGKAKLRYTLKTYYKLTQLSKHLVKFTSNKEQSKECLKKKKKTTHH